MTVKYFDAHFHLQDPRLADITSQPGFGLSDSFCQGITNGTSEEDWKKVAKLSEHPKIRAAYGFHPWHIAQRTSQWFERLQRHLDEDPHALVGEIGLDKWMRNPQFDQQKEVFMAQLDLALERKLPPSIHCLQAWGTLWELLNDRRTKLQTTGFLLHSYSGPPDWVERFAELGAYFSISGYFARPEKAGKLTAWERVPIDRLLIETDAPDMLPPADWVQCPASGESGTVNHPANIIGIYQWMSMVRKIELSCLAGQVEQNFRRLFG